MLIIDNDFQKKDIRNKETENDNSLYNKYLAQLCKLGTLNKLKNLY